MPFSESARHSRTPTAQPVAGQVPEFYMQAMPPLDLVPAVKTWKQAWSRRRKLTRLLRYDDHMLADMGYTRAELLGVTQLPLKVDGHHLLREWRQLRQKTG